MSVSKIFKVLITIVVCVVIGAFVLNIILPNGLNGMVNTVEGMIKNATGIAFDLNGDGITDGDASQGTNKDNSNNLDNDGVGVNGFQP